MGFLTDAVYDLAKLYLRSFCPASSTPYADPSSNSQHAEGESAAEGRGSMEASGTTDHLQFTLFAMHGIPAVWVSRCVYPQSNVPFYVFWIAVRKTPETIVSTFLRMTWPQN